MRIVLAVLVALNLMLVCWGHDQDGHHTDIHLTFLGEPPKHDADSLVIAERAAPGSAVKSGASQQTTRDSNATYRALNAAQTCATVLLSANSLPDGHTVSSLGIAFTLIGALGLKHGARWSAKWKNLRSQITLRPPTPPPRIWLV